MQLRLANRLYRPGFCEWAGNQGPTTARLDRRRGNKVASYNRVRLYLPCLIGFRVKSETKPAAPWSVKRISLRESFQPTLHLLSKARMEEHESSFFTPELVSMTSRNAKEALAISPAYVKSLESDVQSLKAILDARPASLDREVCRSCLSVPMRHKPSFRISNV